MAVGNSNSKRQSSHQEGKIKIRLETCWAISKRLAGIGRQQVLFDFGRRLSSIRCLFKLTDLGFQPLYVF